MSQTEQTALEMLEAIADRLLTSSTDGRLITDPDAFELNEELRLIIDKLREEQAVLNENQARRNERLLEANSLLRSAHSIAEREGLQVNWEAFKNQLSKELAIELPLVAPLIHAKTEEAMDRLAAPAVSPDVPRKCAYCHGTDVCSHGYCRSGKCDDKCPHCPIKEESCGTAVSAAISTNVHTRPIATDVSPSGELFLEWRSLSKESQEKVSKWFNLAADHLQSILDAPVAASPSAGAQAEQQLGELIGWCYAEMCSKGIIPGTTSTPDFCHVIHTAFIPVVRELARAAASPDVLARIEGLIKTARSTTTFDGWNLLDALYALRDELAKGMK